MRQWARRPLIELAVAACAAWSSAAVAADSSPGTASDWQLVGRMGIVQYIIVPESSARDQAYYDHVIEDICPGDATCFVSFFTNTGNAAIELPLPDSIQHQPTVTFRRSAKYGRQEFRWSCRLKMPGDDCF